MEKENAERAIRILEEGVAYKRQGNYQKAIQYYQSAQELDPYNRNVYWNQGKTYYLLNDFALSFSNYLKGCHISIVLNTQRMHSSQDFRTQIAMNLEMTSGVKDISKLDYIVLHSLILGPNILQHIAHAFIDKNSNNLATAQKEAIVEYRKGLAGQPFNDMKVDQFDDVYTEKGNQLVHEYLMWTKLKNENIKESLQTIRQYDMISI